MRSALRASHRCIFLMLLEKSSAPISVLFAVLIAVYALLLIPFVFLIALSLNRDALEFIIKSSEFWIKVIYAAIKPILQIIQYHQVGRYTKFSDLPVYLGYTWFTIRMISSPMTMFIFGAMDGIPRMPYKWKAIMMGLLALQWTWEAVRYQFLSPVEHDYVIKMKATASILSFHSLLSSVCAMLAMFLWKQTIDLVRNRDRCISIAYRPYLDWESSREKSQMNVSVVPDIETLVIEESHS